MSALVVEATYENGVLKLDQPLPLKDQERVRITVEPQINWADRTYGMLGWKGDAETLRRVALDPEFGIEECP